MKVYNTLTRKKEELQTIEEGKVRIYVCGPTVYNFFHIGNARPFVVFDTLRRYLKYRGYDVKFVQNFTDVDDKIINKAREEGVTAPEVSEKYIEEYYKDAAALNVIKADVHPKVSEHIPEIIAFVQTLIDKGYAYEEKRGRLFFDQEVRGLRQALQKRHRRAGVRRPDRHQRGQGRSAGLRPLEGQQGAGRDRVGEPLGHGPSRLAHRVLRHVQEAPGRHHRHPRRRQDLQFPHHENEIAQSECCNGVPFANYWMHNGYITIDNEKMSKSKGNFFTVRDILKEYDGEVMRFFLLSGHYRSPINFSDQLMEQAKASLARMRNAKTTLQHLAGAGADGDMTEDEAKAVQSFDRYRQEFIDAMDDDLNTADGISAIFELITVINTTVAGGATKALPQRLRWRS